MNSKKQDELNLLKQVIKMIHYLPEVHDYFKSYPSKRLLIDEKALLTNKVPETSFADFEDSSNLMT